MKFSVKAFLVSSIAVVASIWAQTDARSAMVEGFVTNTKTGQPVADVRITVAKEPAVIGGPLAKTATTDAAGKFRITGIVPGRYLLTASRTLFFRSRRDSGPAMLTLGEGQRVTDVQILLSPTSVIAGRTIGDKREPLRGVRVEGLRQEFRDGLGVWVAVAQSTTDDLGEYRLFNLIPGTYYIRATQSANAPLFYPGVADLQAAVPVSVNVGAEEGAIDIEMRPSPDYSVQLKLGGVPPGSIATFLIRRRNGIANEAHAARVDRLPDNSYRIGQLTHGFYDLFVQVTNAIGNQQRVLTHAANIRINITNANQDLGTVAIAPTVTVKGRIVAFDSLASPLSAERLVLTLRAMDLIAPITATARGNTTPPGFNSDGSFSLPNVLPGRYQLVLTGLPVDTHLISAREGTREVLDTGFIVTGTQSSLELIVGGPASVGSVTGNVVNALGRPVASSTVVLVPSLERQKNPGSFRTAMTDQSGNFMIHSVLSGDYKLLSWEDVEPGIYMDPEFLKSFETRGEPVKVQRGSHITATVRVIPAQ